MSEPTTAAAERPPEAQGVVDDASPSTTDIVRQIVVLVACLAFFPAAGAALALRASDFGVPAAEVVARWGVLYAGLLLLGINQAMPWRRADQRQRRIGWLLVAAAALNALVIAAVEFELPVVALPVLSAATLAVLVVIVRRLDEQRPTTTYECVVVDGALGLNVGWLCLATVQYVALTIAIETGIRVGAESWIFVIGVVGLLLAIGLRGRIAPAIGLSFGLFWYAVDRAWFPGASVEVAAAVAAVVALGSALVVRARARG